MGFFFVYDTTAFPLLAV